MHFKHRQLIRNGCRLSCLLALTHWIYSAVHGKKSYRSGTFPFGVNILPSVSPNFLRSPFGRSGYVCMCPWVLTWRLGWGEGAGGLRWNVTNVKSAGKGKRWLGGLEMDDAKVFFGESYFLLPRPSLLLLCLWQNGCSCFGDVCYPFIYKMEYACPLGILSIWTSSPLI